MEPEKYYIKDYISASDSILKIVSSDIQAIIMNKSFTLSDKKVKQHFHGNNIRFWASKIVLEEIYKHDISLIYNAISDICDTYTTKHIIVKIAFRENNKELIKRMHKQGIVFHYLISKNEDILSYGYRKHGAEFIRFLSDIGTDLYDTNFFTDIIKKKDDDLLNYLLDVSTVPLEQLFCRLLEYNYNNTIYLITLFIERMDMVSHQDKIFECIHGYATSPIDAIKLVLDYGVTINSNYPLRDACDSGQLDLMEFYLQYGLKADRECLEGFFSMGRFNENAIKILLKYDTDFSVLKVSNPKEDLFIDLENHGLDKSSILTMVLYPKKLKKILSQIFIPINNK